MTQRRLSSRPAIGLFGLLTVASLTVPPLRSIPLWMQGEIPEVRWKDIRAAFTAFSKDPSPPRGKDLVFRLPLKRLIVNEQDNAYAEKLATLKLIFSSEDSARFMARVKNGDSFAIEASLRILNLSDAGDSEDIMIVLGDSLRYHARIVLEVFNKYRGLMSSDDLLAPAVMTRYDLGSDQESHELQMRLEALLRVNDSDLQELRNAFIIKIFKEIRRPVA
jgi:hypothetical protein